MSMSGAAGSKRAILPRSSAIAPAPGPFAEASTSPRSERITQANSSRTNIRSACLACRRRRNRCSGGHPCNRCRALDTECIYNESQDGRTLALRERGKQELEMHKRIVHGLFKAIREGCEQNLLDLIRNNASVEDVAAALDEVNAGTAVSGSIGSTPEPRSASGSTHFAHRNLDYMPPNDLSDFSISDTVDSQTLVPSLTTQTSEGSIIGSGLDISMESNESMLGIRYMLQPLHSQDTSSMQHLSVLYLSARNAIRQILNTGIPASTILGGPMVLCNHLFEMPTESFNITTWASVVINNVAGVDVLFRLAWLCYVTRFLRWTIDPSELNFRLMPAAMVPTALQLEVPHPAVIDLIPLPQIRDTMIRNFRHFTGALELAGATIHWTESIDTAIDQDTNTGNKYVSALFEQHIEDTDNFCFGKSLLTTFPELEGQVQVAEVDHLVSISFTTSPTTSLIGSSSTT